MKQWSWMVQHVVAIALALILGFLLGQIPLFSETPLGSPKLRAAHWLQFFSVGGALFLLWRIGQRLAIELPTLCPRMMFLGPMIVPVTTLMVLVASHPVCGQILRAFVGKTGKGIFNWLFILGMVSAALWVILAWFLKAAPMLQAWEKASEPALKGDRESREPSYVATTGEEPA